MFKKVRVLLLTGIIALGVVGCNTKEAKEDKFKVALVLSQGGVNDQSFNQSAWEGALKAKEEYGVEVSYLESKSESDFTSNIETAIDQDNDLIVGVGFQVGDSIMEASQMYPEQKFATIDSTFEVMPENLRAITFNEEQAGYAAGLVLLKSQRVML
jgi:basic membrane protein A